MRTKKAVTSFDVLYKETFAQQISKAATICRKLSADEFNHVRVVADRLTSTIEHGQD